MSPEGHRHLISKQSIMFHVFGYLLLNERGIHELTSSHDGKGKSSLSSFDKKRYPCTEQATKRRLTDTNSCADVQRWYTQSQLEHKLSDAILNDKHSRPRWPLLPTSLPSDFCWLLLLLSLDALGVMYVRNAWNELLDGNPIYNRVNWSCRHYSPNGWQTPWP